MPIFLPRSPQFRTAPHTLNSVHGNRHDAELRFNPRRCRCALLRTLSTATSVIKVCLGSSSISRLFVWLGKTGFAPCRHPSNQTAYFGIAFYLFCATGWPLTCLLYPSTRFALNIFSFPAMEIAYTTFQARSGLCVSQRNPWKPVGTHRLSN